MTEEQHKQILAIVAKIKTDAYRQGWHDATSALRKVALDFRYNCPVLPYEIQTAP